MPRRANVERPAWLRPGLAPVSWTAVPDAELLQLADVPQALALSVVLRMIARVRGLDVVPPWARPLRRGDPLAHAGAALGYAPRTVRELVDVLAERGVVRRTKGTRTVAPTLAFVREPGTKLEVLSVEASMRATPGDCGALAQESTGEGAADRGARAPDGGDLAHEYPGAVDFFCETGNPPSPHAAVGADAPPLSPGLTPGVGADARSARAAPPRHLAIVHAGLDDAAAGSQAAPAAAGSDPVSTAGVPPPAAPASGPAAPRGELCPELRKHAERRRRTGGAPTT